MRRALGFMVAGPLARLKIAVSHISEAVRSERVADQSATRDVGPGNALHRRLPIRPRMQIRLGAERANRMHPEAPNPNKPTPVDETIVVPPLALSQSQDFPLEIVVSGKRTSNSPTIASFPCFRAKRLL
jgi:hypothetical protein